jgi:hypothetical protein
MDGFTSGVPAKLCVYAYDSSGPITSAGGSITCKYVKDGGSVTDTNDVNPTEVHGGYYLFDLTAAEIAANDVIFMPRHSTATVSVIVVSPMKGNR